MAVTSAMLRPAQAQGQPTDKPRTTLDFRISPAVNYHFHVRALAERRSSRSDDGAFMEAIQVARELDGHLRGWGVIEGNLFDCNTVADIRAEYADLPETYEPRRPGARGPFPMRKLVLTLADAMARTEQHYLTAIWPQTKSALDAAAAKLAKEFQPKQAECIAYMLRHLGIDDPGATIPVYLIDTGPFPGAYTHRRHGGGAVCFVATRDENLQGTLLFETILHESTHALDIASDGKSVFGALRDGLRERGMDRRSPLFRDVPHTLMFVHAGETIRRIVDPRHVHYGDAAAYYPKAPLATRAIRSPWVDYLDGRITRDAAVETIIDTVMKEAGTP